MEEESGEGGRHFRRRPTSSDLLQRKYEIEIKMLATQMEVKDQLIQNLEDIIDEQEARIFQVHRCLTVGKNAFNLLKHANICIQYVSLLGADGVRGLVPVAQV